jgi:hypothetical protein
MKLRTRMRLTRVNAALDLAIKVLGVACLLMVFVLAVGEVVIKAMGR